MVSRLEDCLQQLNLVPVHIRGGGDNGQNTEQSLLVTKIIKNTFIGTRNQICKFLFI